MQYEKFEDWMIGKHVIEIRTGDIGVIQRYYGNERGVADRIWADWSDQSGRHVGGAHILLSLVSFLDDKPEETISPEMILEMNGKRYRLVEIKEN